MRRLLTFLMCVSGFTLAISWTRADESAAPGDAQPAAFPSEPSARPVVVRTEPGAHQVGEKAAERDIAVTTESVAGQTGRAERRQRLDDARLRNWLRIYERQTTLGVPTIVQQRVNDLAEYYEFLSLHEGRDPSSLAQARHEAALIERFLDEVQARQTESDDAQEGEEPSTGKPEEDAKAKRPEQTAPEQIREMQQRMAELQAQRAQNEADGPLARRLERELERLRRLAGEVEQSAGKEAEAVREEIERQIDNVERYLKERRERREAADEHTPPFGASEAEADADVRALHERMRHLQAAIEHLNAAGMHDVARDLQRHAENLRREAEIHRTAEAQREAAKRAAEEAERQAGEIRERRARVAEEVHRQRERAEAAARDAAAAAERQAGDTVREIADQLRELRQELRRMRAELEELRKAHAPPENE